MAGAGIAPRRTHGGQAQTDVGNGGQAVQGGARHPGAGQAGQQEAYLAATMRMYRDKPDPGRDTAMSAPLHGLRDVDLDHLAHYLAQAGRP